MSTANAAAEWKLDIGCEARCFVLQRNTGTGFCKCNKMNCKMQYRVVDRKSKTESWVISLRDMLYKIRGAI